MELVTERLVLRHWSAEDLAPLAAMNADPEVMRYIGDGTTQSLEQTRGAMERNDQRWAVHGFGLLGVELRTGGGLLGWVGFAVPEFLPEILPAVEIGWRFGREHWGHGYATEAARRALEFGFDEAGLDRVVSICQVDNVASASVMTKIGMTEERRTTVPAHGRAVRVFEITPSRT